MEGTKPGTGRGMTEQEKKLVVAFVQGARFWEHHTTQFTMWQSERSLCEQYALSLLESGRLGEANQGNLPTGKPAKADTV